jgi:cell division protein FtsL
MKRLEQEQSNYHSKISGIVIGVLLFLVFMLSAGRVFVANRLVESSDKLRKMDAQIIVLETQNQDLAQNVRLFESTMVIEQLAVFNGFSVNSHFAVMTPTPQMAYGIIQ